MCKVNTCSQYIVNIYVQSQYICADVFPLHLKIKNLLFAPLPCAHCMLGYIYMYIYIYIPPVPFVCLDKSIYIYIYIYIIV